jgi:ATP-dependent exoDNAse (exonuclease V) beta subunit
MNKYQPSKYAKKDWQIQQETNLMYVAVTRAKSELVLVVA